MYLQISVLYIPLIVIETIGKEITVATILHYISSFFIEGIYYHLWFLIALIYYTIFYFKTYKYQKLLYIASIVCYVIGVILHSYSFLSKDCTIFKWIFEHPYIYDNFRRTITYGFPFYILGTQIYMGKDRINKRVINLQIVISIALFLIEIFSLYVYSQSKSYTTTVFLYPVCYFVFCKLLIVPTGKASKMKWDKLATLIYFLHPLVIKIVTEVFKIIEIKVPSLMIYILVVFITLMISFALLKFYNKRKEVKNE